MRESFTALDLIVLVAYLAGTTFLGVYLGRNQKSARDYFVANHTIPWWAVLFSIVATETSALTVISIPGLAYTPSFLLWFGLGNVPSILLVAFVSTFPIIYNAWTGVKAVKDIWVRAAHAMGADDRRLFRHVMLPGALPYVLTGLRLGLAQAWRILVAVEMLAAVPWGLGWMIFGAQEFLNTDVMLSGIAVIALIGVGLEKLVFQPLENFTVVRWGMVTS